MGADMADIDNDGSADIFVTEMLPSEYERLKSVTTFENWDKYKYNVDNGWGVECPDPNSSTAFNSSDTNIDIFVGVNNSVSLN